MILKCYYGPAVLFQAESKLKVVDLFEDLKDGLKIIKLLEVLSGEKIVSNERLLLLSDVRVVDDELLQGCDIMIMLI